ncbi:MAG TPA: hypothetical protein VFB78_07670 [Acidimicrobiales bacterium]|nr:hypothetical protein [Acidimicrobiales bacterium]
MDPTLPSAGPPGDAPQRATLSGRLELVAALLTAVVGLEFLALIVGVSGGGPYRSVGDRIEVVSLNLDAKMALILLFAAMLATLRDVATADFDTPRTDVGRRTLMAVAGLGVVIAVLSLIGVGLDISRSEVTAFGTNTGAAVIHRLAIILMASIAAGWALTALGVRITTASRS